MTGSAPGTAGWKPGGRGVDGGAAMIVVEAVGCTSTATAAGVGAGAGAGAGAGETTIVVDAVGRASAGVPAAGVSSWVTTMVVDAVGCVVAGAAAGCASAA